MKGIIIKDCIDCPFSDIRNPEGNGGTLVCTLGKDGDKEEKLFQMIDICEQNNKIPSWCKLTDIKEIVDSVFYDYGIKYHKRGEIEEDWKIGDIVYSKANCMSYIITKISDEKVCLITCDEDKIPYSNIEKLSLFKRD